MGSMVDESGAKLNDANVVHPNFKKYPVGTEIEWQYASTQPWNDPPELFLGRILAWDTSRRVPDSVKMEYHSKHRAQQESKQGWLDVRAIQVVRRKSPSDSDRVIVDQEKPAEDIFEKSQYADPEKHPVDTRMIVAYWVLGGYSPDRDVTVMAWSDDKTQVKLQVNIIGGTLAWHIANEVLVLKVVDESGPCNINIEDHPTGTKISAKITYEGQTYQDEVEVGKWICTSRDGAPPVWDKVMIHRTFEWSRAVNIAPEVISVLLPVTAIKVIKVISPPSTKDEGTKEENVSEDMLYHILELKRLAIKKGLVASIQLS